MTRRWRGGKRSLIKTPGSLGRERRVANPGSATPGLAGRNLENPRPALRNTVRMEPAAGMLSPRPFPRAAAPPAPHAGPGPPPSATPGLETMAGPPARDAGRLITDPCSGRTYFKGRLLGKVSWGVAREGGEAPLLAFLPARGMRGACPRRGDVWGPDPASLGAPYLMPPPVRGDSPVATRPPTQRPATPTRSKSSLRAASPSRINARRWARAQSQRMRVGWGQWHGSP